MTLRNAWETVICRKRQVSTARTNRAYASPQCTWQPARVACDVLKPSAQQQGVQEVQEVQEFQDAKRSRQSSHAFNHSWMHACMHAAAWSSASAACVDRRVWHTVCSWFNSCTQSPNSALNSFVVQLCSKFVPVTRVQIMSPLYITNIESTT